MNEDQLTALAKAMWQETVTAEFLSSGRSPSAISTDGGKAPAGEKTEDTD